MATVDLVYAPSTLSMRLQGNTALYSSPLTGSVQTLDRGGLKWVATYTYNNLSGDRRGVMLGFVASLRSQANRVRLPVYDNPKRGGYGGTPLVNGGGQTGSSLNVTGVTNKTNWIRAGDYFSVNVNGEHELKMCTADANSSGGAVTISFEPRLRASPAGSAAIYVEDGVLSKPEGLFLFSDAGQGWSSRPGGGGELSSLSLSFIEDVFGTQ